MPKGFRAFAHCVCRIHLHIVFVTKYRHPVINEQIEARLKTMMTRLCETQKCILLECKADLGKQDHIHLLVDMAPDIAVSRLVNTLKTITSREIRKEFAQYLKPYYWKPVFWKRGYCSASVGGATLSVLKQYIEEQGYDD
ncbi:MAG: IS200/IS605 family transposase [Lyngbya sp.]|nr:IS200/IS605 family transposase [Lyngbya sp.]